ncbi:MAG: aldo/keto reductase [Deltaproteobacteria bacterium]|nr:aldo/keto reductase [Deltaproteobacteria bacterium]
MPVSREQDPSDVLSRREVLVTAAGAAVGSSLASLPASAEAGSRLRPLGKTGQQVLPFSLGGEGVLRTVGRSKEAVAVILEALRLGVRYCDTAPAYSQSQDYYGEAFREAGAGARDKVLLASKTHDRSRDGSLRLLQDTLRRIGTDRLDVWQLHDLRTRDDLERIFKKGGALEAVEEAKRQKLIRFAGITGHHDPAILVEAMGRYPFDTVLCAINPSDPRRLPFLTTVVAEARKRNMAVIAMKVLGAGEIVRAKSAKPDELLRYAVTHADTAIIGCSSPAEVRENMAAAERFTPMTTEELRAIETRLAPAAHQFDSYKRG